TSTPNSRSPAPPTPTARLSPTPAARSSSSPSERYPRNTYAAEPSLPVRNRLRRVRASASRKPNHPNGDPWPCDCMRPPRVPPGRPRHHSALRIHLHHSNPFAPIPIQGGPLGKETMMKLKQLAWLAPALLLLLRL